MSEINDAVQIIRVAYDGVEIAMKIGSGSIRMMQKAVDLIVGMLQYEKTMGKSNMKGLLQKGGDIQVLSFADEDMKKFKKLAKKYGILYSVMPDAKRNDGLTEIMFHSEAAPRIRMMCQKLSKGRLYNLDEYLKNGNEEQLNQLLDYLEKQKGNGKLRTEERAVADAAIDGLIQKVGRYATEKKSISVEAVKSDFQVDARQAEDVLSKLEKIGVVERMEGMDSYKVLMDAGDFEKRIGKYQELTNRMRQIVASRNTDLLDITITKKLIEDENDHAIKTRVPGMYGRNAGYIWLDKKDIMEIHDGKTLLTYLDKKKDYKIYSEDNRVLFTMNGEQLFGSHYDKVEMGVRQKYTKMQSSPEHTVHTKTTVRRR